MTMVSWFSKSSFGVVLSRKNSGLNTILRLNSLEYFSQESWSHFDTNINKKNTIYTYAFFNFKAYLFNLFFHCIPFHCDLFHHKTDTFL